MVCSYGKDHNSAIHALQRSGKGREWEGNGKGSRGEAGDVRDRKRRMAVAVRGFLVTYTKISCADRGAVTVLTWLDGIKLTHLQMTGFGTAVRSSCRRR